MGYWMALGIRVGIKTIQVCFFCLKSPLGTTVWNQGLSVFGAVRTSNKHKALPQRALNQPARMQQVDGTDQCGRHREVPSCHLPTQGVSCKRRDVKAAATRIQRLSPVSTTSKPLLRLTLFVPLADTQLKGQRLK